MKKKWYAISLACSMILNQGISTANVYADETMEIKSPISDFDIVLDDSTGETSADHEIVSEDDHTDSSTQDVNAEEKTLDESEKENDETGENSVPPSDAEDQNTVTGKPEDSEEIPAEDDSELTEENPGSDTEHDMENDDIEVGDEGQTLDDTDTEQDSSVNGEGELSLVEDEEEEDSEEAEKLLADNEIEGPLVEHGAEIESGKYQWEIYGDDEVGYTYVANADGFSVPADYKSKITSVIINDGVSTIKGFAFQNCSGLTGNLILPDSVTKIGERAFESCKGFTGDLILPDSVTQIGDNAFSGCLGLKGTLTIPESVISIGTNAFSHCGFTGDLIIPKSVITIGNSAFKYCSDLNGTLTISNSVKSIGANAFENCKKLTGDLIIPNSVTTIGEAAFSNCYGLNGTLTISNSVESIGEHAFASCERLTGTLIIPDSVKSIGEGAFYDCRNLTGLSIANSVKTIGRGAFSACYSFTGDLIIPNSVETIGKGAFENCSGFTGNLTLPGSVTSIGENAFSQCTGLTGTLTLPDLLTTIGDEAFRGCKFTGELILPDITNSIGNRAFFDCSGFTGTLIIPKSVESIGNQAFAFCAGVEAIVLPENLTTLSEGFFNTKSYFPPNYNNINIIIPNSVSTIKIDEDLSFRIPVFGEPPSITLSNDALMSSVELLLEKGDTPHTIIYYDNSDPSWSACTKEEFEEAMKKNPGISSFRPLYTMPKTGVPGHEYDFQLDNPANGTRVGEDSENHSFQYAFQCHCDYDCGASALVTVNRFTDNDGNEYYVSDNHLIGFYQIPGNSSGASPVNIEISESNNFNDISYDESTGLMKYSPSNPDIDSTAVVSVSSVKYKFTIKNGVPSMERISDTDLDAFDPSNIPGDSSNPTVTGSDPDDEFVDGEDNDDSLSSDDNDDGGNEDYKHIPSYDSVFDSVVDEMNSDLPENTNDSTDIVYTSESARDILMRLYYKLLATSGYYDMSQYINIGNDPLSLKEGYYISKPIFTNDYQMILLCLSNPDDSPSMEHAVLTAYIYTVIDGKVQPVRETVLCQNIGDTFEQLVVYAYGFPNISAIYLEGIKKDSEEVYELWNINGLTLECADVSSMTEEERIQKLSDYGIQGNVVLGVIRQEALLQPLFIYPDSMAANL